MSTVKQDILKAFDILGRKKLTDDDILDVVGHKWREATVRQAISHMTTRGHLERNISNGRNIYTRLASKVIDEPEAEDEAQDQQERDIGLQPANNPAPMPSVKPPRQEDERQPLDLPDELEAELRNIEEKLKQTPGVELRDLALKLQVLDRCIAIFAPAVASVLIDVKQDLIQNHRESAA